ncbi:tyrosine-protein phosphatase [Paenibacillus mesophilus]|uniref:tyrosine-protein phosphatase n=1 Tax=Paenibacillus mesophilus TaxID=2582849 RepID=UPI00110F2927|nr:tyrosine-protein phosphatase [Paenibacillus mesophilus]TMV43929.1 tyrosine-protein phosphatase [Paenibacillus mesophilus]
MTTLMPPCLLPLEGAVNFRDLGGLRTADGRTVKHGLLFRAAELTGLTAEDHRQLNAISFKNVLDYRNKAEAELKPDPAIGQAVNTRIPVNPAADAHPHLSMEDLFKNGLHRVFTADMLLKMYSDMPLSNASYKQLMQMLREPERHLPLVQHCAGGRDRTGVGSMLILLTLGVPYETVMEDYLLSNTTLVVYHDLMFEMAARYMAADDLLHFQEAMRLQERYLDAAMNSITQAYGAFDRYLDAEFSIDTATRQKIQAYCLE